MRDVSESRILERSPVFLFPGTGYVIALVKTAVLL